MLADVLQMDGKVLGRSVCKAHKRPESVWLSGCLGCEVVLMMSVATIEKMAESR